MDETENLFGARGSEPSAEDSAVSFSLLHSTKVGRYSILKRLGQGAFGKVFLAYDEELDRPVAIKVPNPERISQPGDLDAFLNEARILASLDHPQIVPVYDVGQTEDGRYFIVSKFIDGSDLKTKSTHARLTLQETAELTRQVAEALHYAHKKGLVHRDIKPANILLDTSGKPCVADFGLALKDEDFGKGARLAGTPAYMSPEQAKGKSHQVDGRSDIFSLGVVLYELLTGRKPFRGESYEEVLEQIINSEPRPPRQIDDTIPGELERICLRSLSKHLSERYTTAKDIVEDLRHYQQACGDKENRTIALAIDESNQPEDLFAQIKIAEEKLRKIEAKGLLGRTGCVVQVTILCSLLNIFAVFTFRPSTVPSPSTPISGNAPALKSLESPRLSAPFSEIAPSPNEVPELPPTISLIPMELSPASSRSESPPMLSFQGNAVSMAAPKPPFSESAPSRLSKVGRPPSELPDDVFAPPTTSIDRSKEANRLDALATSYAQAGDFMKAVYFQSRANELYTNADDRKKGDDRLKQYQQRRPYREQGK